MRISPNRKNISIIGVHVDDMGLFCTSVEERERAKAELKKEFPINDLGEPELLLGLKITRDRKKRTITISQTHYIDSLLEKFGMTDANPASTPLAYSTTLSKQMSPKTQEEIDAMKDIPYQVVVGSLMYAAICTRPDISHAVGLVSQFSTCYGPQHWTAVKHILRYLKGTGDYCLTFGGSSLQPSLTAFSDADYAQNPDHQKSTTGHIIRLGDEGKSPVIWKSCKQSCVTTSTVEAEYVAACTASKDISWLRLFFTELSLHQSAPTPLFIDNAGTIFLTKDNSFHPRSKHIDVQYH